MSFQRLFAIGVACLCARSAQAQVTWQGGGTDANFGTVGNWVSGTAPTVGGNADVTFASNATGSPLLSTNYSLNSISYQSGVTGLTIQNSGGATLTIQSLLTNNSFGSNQTIAAPVILGSAFTFSGAASTSQSFVTLTGGLTASAGFTATDGVYLQITGPWNASGAVTLQNGAALEYTGAGRTLTNGFVNNANLSFNTGANTTLVNGAISGTGAVNVASSVTLGAANTYSGSTNLAAGTLADSAPGAFSPNSAVSISTTATLLVNNNETIHGLNGSGGTVSIPASGTTLTITGGGSTFGGVIGGAGGLALSGGAFVTLTGANNYSSGTTINNNNPGVPQNALQIGAGGTTGSVVGPIVNNGFVTFNRSNAMTFSGGISGTGSVSQSGGGTLTLGGINSYSGSTFIGSNTTTTGVLTDAADNAFSPSSSVSIYGGTLAVTGNETIHGLSDLTLSTATPTVLPGAVTLASGKTLTIAGSGSTFSGAITGSGGLALSGGALLTLTGANTYSGITVINDNNPTHSVSIPQNGLQIGNGGTTGSMTGAVTNNGFVNFNRSDGALVFSGGISGTGSVNQNGTGTLTLGGANTYSGSTNLNAGTLADAAAGSFSPNSGMFFFSGLTTLNVNFNETIKGLGGISAGVGSTTNLANGVTLTISPSGLTYGGSVTGGATSALVLSGSGTQALTGANSYGGGTTIGPGTILQLGASGVNSGLTGSITGNVLDNGTLIFDRADNLTFSGVISGTGSLVQNGAGTLTLTGTNTYGAATTISSGTLQVGDGGTAGSIPGGVFLNNNGTLAFNRSDAVTFGNAINGNGNLVQAGTGTLTLTGGNVYSGVTTINAGGTLSIGNGGTTGSLNGAFSVSLVDNGTLIFNRSDSTSFSGLISGVGSLIKRGTGVLTLSNSSSNYSGKTTIEAGVLAVSSLAGEDYNSSLGAPYTTTNSTIAIGSGTSTATLRFTGSGSSVTDRPIDLAGTTGGAVLDMSGSGSVVFNGVVTASGVGTKTLTLAGNNSGLASLFGAIPDSSGGATALNKVGSGTWLLGGQSTYTGNTVINGGTLATSVSNALPANSDIVINATNGNFNAALNIGPSTTQAIGNVTFGGPSSAPGSNDGIYINPGATLTLGGTVTFNATGNASGSPFGSYISGGTLSLGAATRTFNVGDTPLTSWDLELESAISGPGAGLTKTGAGGLLLSGLNTYDGATTVAQGTLLLGSSSNNDDSGHVSNGPVGKGSLILQSGTILAPASTSGLSGSGSAAITIGNPVSVASGVTFGTTSSHDNDTLTLAGPVSATAATTTVHTNSDLIITGPLQGLSTGSAIVVDNTATNGGGFFALAGPVSNTTSSTPITSITATNAAILFGTQAAIPTGGTTVKATNGYVSVAATSYGALPSANALIAQIDKANFTGAFGFDTDVDSLGIPQTFTFTTAAPLDVSGFGSGVTIGSATAAILAGPIKPPSTGYRFGNGGGALFVQSSLTDANGAATSVTVNSSLPIAERALTTVFEGDNSFTGAFNVTNSLAILDSAHALPAGKTANLGANAYLGFTESFTSDFATFANRIAPGYAASAVLGFDSSEALNNLKTEGDFWGGRAVTQPIDLTAFGPIAIGTTTGLLLTGRIIAPNQGTAARTLTVVAVNKGDLLLQSALRAGDVSQLIIGSATGSWKDGTIELGSNNAHTGGTTLVAGTVELSAGSKTNSSGAIVSGPFGTGTFTVAANPNHRDQILVNQSGEDLVLHNPVSLSAALQIGFQDMFSGGTFSALSEAVSSQRLVFNGAITGTGGLTLFDDTLLNGANAFTGGVTLSTGTLGLGSDSALGTGALTIAPQYETWVALDAVNGSRTIANAVTFAPNSSWTYLGFTGSKFTFSGPVTLNSGTTMLEPDNAPITFTGVISNPSSGVGHLSVNGSSAVILNPTSGANAYTGGTDAQSGALIFGSAAAIPAIPQVGLTASSGGYIGIAFVPASPSSLQSGFIDRFNKGSTNGTIGFDTLSGNPTSVFTDPINLGSSPVGGFFGSSAKLGSATTAILNGTITPQGTSYNFGGGGGRLEVNSGLVDSVTARNLSVSSSSSAPLTLRLGGTNTYTGGTSINSSALIFKAGAMPTSGWIAASGGSYVGTEEADPTTFLGRVFSVSNNSIVGFDSFTGTPYALTAALSWPSPELGRPFLGTATAATISGPITATGSQTTYGFAGYKGGQLTVSSVLADNGSTPISVQVGDSNNPATFGTPTNWSAPHSSVTLSGQNTYTGGTTLAAGNLLVTGSSSISGSTITNGPLGTGILTVAPVNFGDELHPALLAVGGFSTLANPIALNGDLDVGDYNGLGSLTLTGVISGAGELYKIGTTALTLSGTNTFSGGLYISSGTVNLNSPTAAGTGPLQFGFIGSITPIATFNVSSTINGIAGDNASDQVVLNGAGVTVTINQTAIDGQADVVYPGTFGGSGSLVFKGNTADPTKLRLTGSSSFVGGSNLQPGVVVIAANDHALGTGGITLDGGKLVVDGGSTVSNALAFTAAGGKLGGTGTFVPNTTITAATNVALTPGGNGVPGTLRFGNGSLGATPVLTLAGGGTYAWQISDADQNSGIWDQINVTGAVNVSATSAAPFTFKITPAPLDLLGSVANFNPGNAYSWGVLTATSITGFTASSFAIDSSALSGFTAGGAFSFSLNPASTSLLLNFTPVPEPSTWVLFGLGGLLLAFVARRRVNNRA